MKTLNNFVLKYIHIFELIGVVMRILSFATVSYMGPASPFLFVWIFNTIDAVILTWCSILKKDKAYSLLNIFWILVGFMGIFKSFK
jgi:hypothetical protein